MFGLERDVREHARGGEDVGIFASDSPVSIDAAFLQSVDYKVFNESSHIDCMVQVQEAKSIGIEGEVQPKIEILT